MASDAVGAEEVREKFRWTENSKVYSRKIHRANKNTTTSADAAVAGVPAENDKETDVSQTNDAARDAETPAADGGDFVAPPDSQASPAMDVDSQPQLPVSPNLQSPPAKDSNSELPQPVSPNNSQSSPAKDDDSELPQSVSLVSQPSPAKDAISEPPQLVSQSSPAKDASSEPPQPVLPAMDASSEPPQMVSQSSPAKDADSELPQPVSPVSQSSPAKDANSELPPPVSPVTQSSPARDANSEQPQLQPVSPVRQSSPARDANSEPPQPVSQSSPAKDVNSQPPAPQRVSPISHSSPAKDVTSQPESHSSPAKDTNSQPPRPDSPRTEAVELVCDDSSSLNRQEGDLPNGNGVAPVRPVVTRVGDRVSISLSAATPKHEARELKRKLLSDLDQVRSLAKRLDTKEVQVYSGGLTTSADAGAGGIMTVVPVQSLSQYSTSEGLGKGGGLRAHSEGVSTGLNNSRPFRRLSVSVMDGNRSGSGANETALEKEKRTPKANQFYQNPDFICGKDKFPPAESNKKQKTSGRKKHGVGGSEFDKHIFKKCGSLLQQLMKHKFGWVFNTPVDVKGLGLHDYHDIITNPMDLGTVKSRLNKNFYKSPSDFAEDVRLTFSNAMKYNPVGQDVHLMAAELYSTFEQKWGEIQLEYNSKLRYEAAYDMGLPTPTSRLAPSPFYVPPQPTTPVPRPVYPEMRQLDRSESFALPVESRMKPVSSAPVGRAPKKPKAKDPNKRNMTFDEKTKLSTNLQALPSDKLDHIVHIITKRNQSLCQQDEEVEVDIDSVDAETLWELDRFVTNYKKTLSKHKRKAELALQKSQTPQLTMQVYDPGAQRPEIPKETTPDNANPAAAASPVRDGKQADNASGSSSSSSSSSDSGSSSSDSDSDSSSGSGSEGGE